VFHVVVLPEVSQRVGEILSGRRTLVLRVFNRLYIQLENLADRYRNNRDPEDENLFDYVQRMADGSTWYTLRFSVDDVTAPDYLFVVAVEHRIGFIGFG
jgi:hypothetical protein